MPFGMFKKLSTGNKHIKFHIKMWVIANKMANNWSTQHIAINEYGCKMNQKADWTNTHRQWAAIRQWYRIMKWSCISVIIIIIIIINVILFTVYCVWTNDKWLHCVVSIRSCISITKITLTYFLSAQLFISIHPNLFFVGSKGANTKSKHLTWWQWRVQGFTPLLLMFSSGAQSRIIYATALGEASIPQVTECYFGFVEQKSRKLDSKIIWQLKSNNLFDK